MGDAGEHATYLVASAPEGEQCRDLSNSWTCPHRRHALGVGQLHRPQHTHQLTVASHGHASTSSAVNFAGSRNVQPPRLPESPSPSSSKSSISSTACVAEKPMASDASPVQGKQA